VGSSKRGFVKYRRNFAVLSWISIYWMTDE
jgi:hypothetical protein